MGRRLHHEDILRGEPFGAVERLRGAKDLARGGFTDLLVGHALLRSTLSVGHQDVLPRRRDIDIVEALAVGEVVPVDIAHAFLGSLQVKLGKTLVGLEGELEVRMRFIVACIEHLHDEILVRSDQRQGDGDCGDGVGAS